MALSGYSRTEGRNQRSSNDYLAVLQKTNSLSSNIFDTMHDHVQALRNETEDEQQFRDVDDEELDGEADREVDEGSSEVETKDFVPYVASFFAIMGIEKTTLAPGDPRVCEACAERHLS